MSYSGIVLIVVGSVLLAHNLGWLEWSWLRQWWPGLLILLGVWSLLSHRAADNERRSKRSGSDPT